MKKNKVIFALLILSMLLSLVSCAQNSPQSTEPATTPAEKKTLWIVTEEDVYDKDNGLNRQIQRVIKDFNLAHKDVKVTLEILPSEKDNLEARTQRIAEIQTAISTSHGPDIYLIPIDYRNAAPLFKDVQQAMHNGVFADISTYYDADEALGKEELITAVMDGGVVDDARYVLPLSYSFSTLYADRALVEAAGLDLEAASSDFITLYNALCACDDTQWCAVPWVYSANGFSTYMPQMIDYASGSVIIDEAQMTAFLDTLSTIFATTSVVPILSLDGYIDLGCYFSAEAPIIMHSVTEAIPYAVASKLVNQDLIAIPVRATDGDLVANITYYGAVGSSCRDPGLAYDFLREFLTEDVQLQVDRLKYMKPIATTFAAGGLPVRGTVAELWEIEKTIYKSYSMQDNEAQQRKKAAMSVVLSDEDVPVLSATIDRVVFPTYFDQKIMYDAIRKMLYEPENSDVSAEDLISLLNAHIAG